MYLGLVVLFRFGRAQVWPMLVGLVGGGVDLANGVGYAGLAWRERGTVMLCLFLLWL